MATTDKYIAVVIGSPRVIIFISLNKTIWIFEYSIFFIPLHLLFVAFQLLVESGKWKNELNRENEFVDEIGDRKWSYCQI